jgi:16S rRNA processing protein RimM
VYKFTAQDVWVVKNGTTEHLIPAVKEFVERVDVNTKTIIINPIEGLLNEIGRGKRDED